MASVSVSEGTIRVHRSIAGTGAAFRVAFVPYADNIRAIANDAETKEMAMPAQYMFKGVPTYDHVDDPVALALAEMDKHNVRRALMAVHENEHAQRGFREHRKPGAQQLSFLEIQHGRLSGR